MDHKSANFGRDNSKAAVCCRERAFAHTSEVSYRGLPRQFTPVASLLFYLALTFSALSISAGATTITGRIHDTFGGAVVGASVSLCAPESTLTGAIADADGQFVLESPVTGGTVLEGTFLRIEALGFESVVVALGAKNCSAPFEVSMTVEPVVTEGIVVEESRERQDVSTLRREEIIKRGERSILPTNALASVHGSRALRVGPVAGSLIRFTGVSPEYTVGGVSIGKDQAHYGMFSLLPTSSLSSVSFSDHPAGASTGAPGVIELSPKHDFNASSAGDLTLAFSEAAGAYSAGTSRMALTGAVRKSTLDKIAQRVSFSTDRVTIPPTNFQDLALFGAARMNDHVTLTVDQFHSQDFLAFNTAATTLNTAGVETFQHTRKRFFSVGIESLTPATLIKGYASILANKSLYRAHALDVANPDALNLDLEEHSEQTRLGLNVTRQLGLTSFQCGAEIKQRNTKSFTLTQHNWNFQPPFATSDLASEYQFGLNQSYDSISVSGVSREYAAYSELNRKWQGWTAGVGVRYQRYTALGEADDILFRASLCRSLGGRRYLEGRYGTYAETPYGAILDPYQALVRQNMRLLTTVKTSQTRVTYRDTFHRSINSELYFLTKEISELPRLVSESGALTMRSAGRERYYGVGASIDGDLRFAQIAGRPTRLSLSYAYTTVAAFTYDQRIHISEDVPHKFESQCDIALGHGWDANVAYTVRTGLRYTTPPENAQSQSIDQNGVRFPTHTTLNVAAGYSFSSGRAFFSLGNVFNHANPIISSADGFIYDNGILPSVGLKLNL